MARARTIYRCTECGAAEPKWAGRCGGCEAWNSLGALLCSRLDMQVRVAHSSGKRPSPLRPGASAAALAGWAALLPWTVGWDWPGPSLVVLGLLLLGSPLIDRWLARHVALPAGWLTLRGWMAGGLGVLTLALAFAGGR